ncbi:unnamed protein product [Mesocestoides corti]|uniref:Uncharacterized protein n=1 Tax=Mesocestoides corti TaxID=53468 RepID=A0A158QVJ2_MESCO|nr:unnamed protein product [Mesocestoides corti]
MAKRGSIRRGFGGEYRKPDPSAAASPRTPRPAPQRNRTPAVPQLPASSASPGVNFIPDRANASFGDIFTAVLGSKLASQSVPKKPQVQSTQDVEPPPPPEQRLGTEKRTPTSPAYLEPTTFVCRPREDRERQLDTRCLRIIRKLNAYTEYQEIVRRFASQDGDEDVDVSTQGCVDKSKLRSSCGLRAYLLKILRLKEPRHSLAVSQTTLLCSDKLFAAFSTRRITRGNSTLDHPSELEDSWTLDRSMTNASPGHSTNLTPETLLRRLARSLSTRLAHKRNLLEHATNNVTELEKETDVVRCVLRKVAEAIPQMRTEVDACYFHIPHTSPSPAEPVEMKVCQVPSAGRLPPGRRVLTQDVTSNLSARFDRLLSSQTSVLELLCQLTRRLYSVERRIESFPLQSRRQQLKEQINEAQRLRDDLENTKARLLTGLQYQFYVLHDSQAKSDDVKSNETSFSMSDGQECYNSSGRSSPSSLPRSGTDSAVCLAEFVSRHLVKYLQALLIKLSLEAEIFHDQEVVDCIGEHLRLVASFSP